MEVTLKKWEEENYKNGGFESMLNRFNALVQSSGLFSELKRREYYEKPNEKRRRKLHESMMKRSKKERKRKNALHTTREEDKIRA